jgi:hypothetical protein
MTEHDLPELPPDVAALLADARGTPSAPASERRRVAGRLALTVGMAIPAASLAGARVAAPAWITKALGLATLVALAGGAAHLATRHRSSPVRASIARPAVVTREPERVVPVAPTLVPTAAPQEPTPVAVAPPALAATPRRVDEDRAFQEELSLLDRAVEALGRGDVTVATGALSQHARRFPRGRLSPEREAMRVRCAAASGDPEAAEAARRRFHQRYPHSVLGAAVDRAVDGASR